MKTLKRVMITTAVMGVLFLIIPVSLLAQDVIAYIGEVGGTVTVVKGNPGEEVEAQLGMLLMGGDTVKTASASYSSVIFQDDGSRVKLGENSQLTLNADRDGKNLKKKMFLDSGGKLWAKVNKKRGTDFQVRTPTSVASVKGTKFILEAESDGAFLWVLEDAVVFESGEFVENVGAGEYAEGTAEGIIVRAIEDGDVPVEPGSHEILIFFDQGDRGTALQKELRIEYKK
jgi:hypothetical protein